jgi:hypothetical protein
MSLIQKTRTVYIVSSALTPKVYIGSTCMKLSKRLSDHKHQLCKAREIIELGQYKISPLCVIENCTKKEIELKESDFIFCFKDICVNFRGTKDSYSENYNEPCRLNGRRKEQQKIKNDCSICGGSYSNANKAKHFRTNKHLACM